MMTMQAEARTYAAAVKPLGRAAESRQDFAAALHDAARPLIRRARVRTEFEARMLDAVVAAELPGFGIDPEDKLGRFARERVKELAMLPWQLAMFKGHYQPNAVVFDGTNDWLSLTNPGFSGAADSKLFTIAVTFVLANVTSDKRIIQIEAPSTTSSRFRVLMDDPLGDVIRLNAKNAAGTDILDVRSSAVSASTQYNLLASFDLSDTGKRHLYVNDSSDLATVSVYTNDTIDFTGLDIGIGASEVGATKFAGEMADLWLDLGRYVDLSVEANRRLFFTADNKLVYKGLDGSVPFGAAPTLFLSGPTDDWHTNKGTGGGMTENGALTTSSSPPPGA